MQEKEVLSYREAVLLPVPRELLEEAGINPYDIVQYTVKGKKIIIEALRACGGSACPDCPFREDCAQ